jgi:ATP-binding cassette subfamily B protein
VGIVVALGTALVLWYGGALVAAGTLSAGSLVVFVSYLGKMYKPMQDFAKMTDAFTKASVGYERVREVLETPPTVEDRPKARRAPALQGRIEFEHVGFSYSADRPVLTDICLRAEAGRMTALVGPTGSGKTTIASLIGRFYDPDHGVVMIDGIDLRDFEQKTAIVIAHRFSTIRRANTILVIEDGRIVESGTHEQLLPSGGLYTKLYQLQFRKEEVMHAG